LLLLANLPYFFSKETLYHFQSYFWTIYVAISWLMMGWLSFKQMDMERRTFSPVPGRQ
jgi:hypothetical protein